MYIYNNVQETGDYTSRAEVNHLVQERKTCKHVSNYKWLAALRIFPL